jgi:hypothetical protein
MPRSHWIVTTLAVAALCLSAGPAPAAGNQLLAVGDSTQSSGRESAPQPSLAIDAVLPAQERQALQIAQENGDRDFIMIDKALGRIVVFHDGEPAWTGATLTGESPLDSYSLAVLALPESHKFTTLEKITPAGRFTVRRTEDDVEGTVLELAEVHGNGWYLALHRVFTGTPSEHRMQRLASSDPADKHITFGCINVSVETMRYLTTHLPKRDKTPLYILPMDQSLTSSLLALGKTAADMTAAVAQPKQHRR